MIDDKHIDWRAFFCAMRNIVSLDNIDEKERFDLVMARAGEYEEGRLALAMFLDTIEEAKKL